MGILSTVSVARTLDPSDVIPSHTLDEFGADSMQREFADLAKTHPSCKSVDGWTVTLEAATDDPEYLTNKFNEWFSMLPAKSQEEFA